MFDHETLDGYRVSLDFVGWAYGHARSLESPDRHARDPLLRVSQSIPLNIAERTGKLPSPDRLKSLHIALGSALECSADLDVLRGYGAMSGDAAMEGKRRLERIAARLTRMRQRNGEMNDQAFGYECEYEFEYDARSQGKPGGASNAASPRRCPVSIGCSRGPLPGAIHTG